MANPMNFYKKKGILFYIFTVFLVFIIFYISAEFLLRFSMSLKSNTSELLDYGDTYKSGLENWSHGGKLKENFSGWVSDGYGGKVWWANNSAGFRNNREYDRYPPSGVLRILSIGDSFTAGYRVGQYETFSYLLEDWLNKKGSFGEVEVLISNIEDPVKGLYYLISYGQFYHPHIVILGITLGNDLTQSYIGLDPQGAYTLRVRGEDIRIENNKDFNTNDFMQRLKIYDISRKCLKKKHSVFNRYRNKLTKILDSRFMIFKLIKEKIDLNRPQAIISWYGDYEHPKLFDGINGLGMYLNSSPFEIEKAYKRFFEILSAYKKYCDLHGIKFAVTIFPQRFQIQPGDWEETVNVYGLDKRCFDTMRPNDLIMKFCRKNKIICIDPTEGMSEKYGKEGISLYLPKGDMHWNKLGHEAYFEATREEFTKILQVVKENILREK